MNFFVQPKVIDESSVQEVRQVEAQETKFERQEVDRNQSDIFASISDRSGVLTQDNDPQMNQTAFQVSFCVINFSFISKDHKKSI